MLKTESRFWLSYLVSGLAYWFTYLVLKVDQYNVIHALLAVVTGVLVFGGFRYWYKVDPEAEDLLFRAYRLFVLFLPLAAASVLLVAELANSGILPEYVKYIGLPQSDAGKLLTPFILLINLFVLFINVAVLLLRAVYLLLFAANIVIVVLMVLLYRKASALKQEKSFELSLVRTAVVTLSPLLVFGILVWHSKATVPVT